jgi:hypothetical protein
MMLADTIPPPDNLCIGAPIVLWSESQEHLRSVIESLSGVGTKLGIALMIQAVAGLRESLRKNEHIDC